MTGRIFLKLIGGTLCVLLVALAAADILASKVAEQVHRDTLVRELSYGGASVCAGGNREGARLTRVAADGRVTFDSEAATERMDNHRDRPEVASALAGGTGVAVRRSGTIGTEFLYGAVPCRGGAVRLAVPLEGVAQQIDGIRRRMLSAIVIAFAPAFVVAFFFARSAASKLGSIIDYASKLAEGRFQARIERPGTDELGQLGQKLNDTAANLAQLVDELDRERQALHKQEQVRKDFVMNVSHELRTPLAAIQGYTETLMNGAIDDPRHNMRFLEIIAHNAERLGSLAGDLLTLSAIEQRARQSEPSQCHVNTLLLDAAESMRPLADKRRVRINIEAAPDHAEVFADLRATHQVFGNLLENAIKYSPEGGEVALGARPNPARAVEFYVRDHGVGIPPEDLPRLFERFYRVDKARSRELGGTGLGLAIVKHLVRAQGGDVGVESEPGKGSTFRFTLPSNGIHATVTPP